MNTMGLRVRNHDTFLARQPILDRNLNAVAFELLTRSSRFGGEAEVSDDAVATANVVAGAFRRIGIHTVVGKGRAFVNLDAESLLSPMVETLPREQTVLELLETIELNDRIIRRCHNLKSKGYRLALDDFSRYEERFEPLLDIVDIVKVDVLQLDPASLAELVKKLRLWPARLLAEKVDTLARAHRCRALGFDLFQGFAWGRPAVLTA